MAAIYKSSTNAAPSGTFTSCDMGKPAVDGVGGVLLAVMGVKNNDVHSCADSNWTKLAQVDSGTGWSVSFWSAAETASEPTITWANAANVAPLVLYYRDDSGVPLAIPALGSPATSTGSTDPHTSTAITSASAFDLAVLIDAQSGYDSSTAPSGWTFDADGGRNTGAGCRIVAYHKAFTASGQSSGSTSQSEGSNPWVTAQIEILTDSASDALDVSSLEMIAWLTPGTIPDPGGSRRRQLVIIN